MYGDAITWNNHDIFDCVLNYLPLGNYPLLVCNHSLIVIGSSDFTCKLDSNEIIISNSEHNKEEFSYVESGRVSTEAFIASCPPTILLATHTRTGRKFTLVDIANFGAKYMEDIYNNLSKEDKEAIYNESELGISEDNSLTCCTLIAMFMKKYSKLCYEHKLGGICLTYSSQGMRTFRSKFYQDNIFTHNSNKYRILEDNCYLGGRVQELYHGLYNGKVYLLDIQSLYPHLGKIKPFPTSLQDSQYAPSQGTIARWVDAGLVAAYCHIETPLPAYPKKMPEGLTFPVGSFNTHLIGEEFSDAWKEGRVKHVYHANLYSCDYILREYSSFMLSLRTKYKGANDRLAEFIVKCVTNGLWGKFGQCGNMWVIDDAKIADRPYGGFYQFDPIAMKKYQYRIIDYVVSKLEYAPWVDNTFIPISAVMNSYSRHYLWRHMLQAGLHNVLYTCVDGMIVTQEGYDRLAWLIAPNPYVYGMYKVSESGDSCYIAGYGKYAIGNKTAYQGVPKYRSKQYRGFWSVMDDYNLLQTKEVMQGNTVEVIEGSLDLRDRLRSEGKDYGRFTDSINLHESILPYNPDAPYIQSSLWHDSEWNQ